MKTKPLHDAALALLAAEFVGELDALLRKHDARLHFSWAGKRAKIAVVFNADPKQQLPLAECRKDKGAYYVSPVQVVDG